MVSFFEASLTQLSIHKTGNKAQDEFYVLSEKPVSLNDEELNKLLMQYFLGPFEKTNEVYRFYHSGDDLDLNEVYHYASALFNAPGTFHENTELLAKYLYDLSTHPKIKPGELYVALFDNVQIEGELHQAVGIFKSETKETYLKVFPEQNGFNLSYENEGINIHKLDKGCLIFNTEKEEGYKVVVIDQTNRNQEAVYWKDEFLKLKIRNDNYSQTNAILGVYKDFVTTKLDEEFEISKADKIDLLNRSMKYFKEKEQFELKEFSQEVIGNEQGIASFLSFKKNYENEFETGIADSFEISGPAVKKQSRVYKSVLKLDKNFHIYIHGNKDMIEKGFDEEKSLNYYKVYFREEQ
ncbi:nucleoid-associated protein [Pedobacter sp. BS3]|uniref:nucleoid-associated protein n=1 Tax=Pedobacter sp. BS3 TaxID=2567937 RepID=UPI0011F023CD|nr:nucleoid-associated protein [Pedobacter sp. BS3]TZF84864.1 nucleoid-associated protein [Pedobacter sp. BS3]